MLANSNRVNRKPNDMNFSCNMPYNHIVANYICFKFQCRTIVLSFLLGEWGDDYDLGKVCVISQPTLGK